MWQRAPLQPKLLDFNASCYSALTHGACRNYTVRNSDAVSAIPKIIILTHSSKEALNPGLIPYLKELNPGWGVRFFNDEDILRYLRTQHPLGLLTYQQISSYAHRADFFRYYYLTTHGGFYLDADNLPLAPLDNLTAGIDFVTTIGAIDYVHQGVLASAPHNPVLDCLLMQFVRFPNPPDIKPPIQLWGTPWIFPYHFFVHSFFLLCSALIGAHLKPNQPYNLFGLRTVFLLSDDCCRTCWNTCHSTHSHFAFGSDRRPAFALGIVKLNTRFARHLASLNASGLRVAPSAASVAASVRSSANTVYQPMNRLASIYDGHNKHQEVLPLRRLMPKVGFPPPCVIHALRPTLTRNGSE